MRRKVFSLFLIGSVIMLLTLFRCVHISAVSSTPMFYDVESMKITNDYIEFKGWAILNKMHNNYKGNTSKIEIFALAVGETDESKWRKANVSQHGGYNKALYEANCIKYNRGSGENVGKCVESYNNATCSGGNSSCRYDNAGFTAYFNLKDLLETFGKDSDITFKIRVTINGTQGTWDLAVYREVSNVDINEKFEGRDVTVTVSELSSHALVRADRARVIKTTSGDLAAGENFYWNYASNNRYSIISVESSTNPRFCGSGNCLKMYKLNYAPTSGHGCFQVQSGNASPNGSCPGYAYSSWLRVDGRVVISLGDEETPEKKQCDDINDNLTCNDEKEYNTDCNSDVTAEIVGTWADAKKDAPDKAVLCDVQTETTLTANINFKENGKLKFDNPTTGSFVYAGGGFTFSTDYENVASWRHAEEPSCPTLRYTYYIKGRRYVCGRDKDGKPKTCKCSCSTCESSGSYYSHECPAKDEYRGSIAEKKVINLVQARYKKVADEIRVELPDSSPVKGSYDFNKWKCELDGEISSWEENSDIELKCKYTLPNAWISKQDSSILYTDDMGPDENYLIRLNQYYIALKQPTGTVYIKMDFPELSVIPSVSRWHVSYECGVECQQRLYDLDGEGDSVGLGYLYYFRPITLADPFPDRDPGKNWISWINDSSNQKRLLETYTSDNNIEYTVTLTSSDIQQIKKYNYDKLYGGGRGYLDYSIDPNGNSGFIKSYSVFRYGNVNHSGLGVFDPGDDMQ